MVSSLGLQRWTPLVPRRDDPNIPHCYLYLHTSVNYMLNVKYPAPTNIKEICISPFSSNPRDFPALFSPASLIYHRWFHVSSLHLLLSSQCVKDCKMLYFSLEHFLNPLRFCFRDWPLNLVWNKCVKPSLRFEISSVDITIHIRNQVQGRVSDGSTLTQPVTDGAGWNWNTRGKCAQTCTQGEQHAKTGVVRPLLRSYQKLGETPDSTSSLASSQGAQPYWNIDLKFLLRTLRW